MLHKSNNYTHTHTGTNKVTHGSIIDSNELPALQNVPDYVSL